MGAIKKLLAFAVAAVVWIGAIAIVVSTCAEQAQLPQSAPAVAVKPGNGPPAKPDIKRSSKWPAVRAVHLKANPTCEACGCSEVKFLEVHHIRPFRVDRKRELDPTNLITLCEKPGHWCHFVFGHNHDWKAHDPNVREEAARHLSRVKNRQYD